MSNINKSGGSLPEKSMEDSARHSGSGTEPLITITRDHEGNPISVHVNGQEHDKYDLLTYGCVLGQIGKMKEAWALTEFASGVFHAQNDFKFGKAYGDTALRLTAMELLREWEGRRETLSSWYWEHEGFCECVGMDRWWNLGKMCGLFGVYGLDDIAMRLEGLLCFEDMYHEAIPSPYEDDVIMLEFLVDEETLLRIIPRLVGEA